MIGRELVLKLIEDDLLDSEVRVGNPETDFEFEYGIEVTGFSETEAEDGTQIVILLAEV